MVGPGLALSTLRPWFSWPIAHCDLGRAVSSVRGNRRAQPDGTIAVLEFVEQLGEKLSAGFKGHHQQVSWLNCVPSRDVAVVTRSDCDLSDCGKGGLCRQWGHDGLAWGAPIQCHESPCYKGVWRDGHARGHGMTHGEAESPTCSCMTHTCSFMTLLTARLPHPPCALGAQLPTWQPPASGAAAAGVDSSPWLVSP